MSETDYAALAADLAANVLGERPIEVRRFTTGAMHYVFEAKFARHAPVVVRIAATWGHDAMRSAARLSHLLRPKGVPLPAMLAEDLAHAHPYLILERLPGGDLGDVVGSLSDSTLEAIAARIVAAQKITHRLPTAGRYGYAATPEDAPHATWSHKLEADIARSRDWITKAGLFDSDPADAVATLVAERRAELDAIPATPFLHDTTTRNVIVTADGAFSGIVDIDDLCYGDPRYVVALTLTALLAWRQPTRYVDIWMRLAGYRDDRIFRIYVAEILLGFMSEHGQVANGNPAPSSPEQRAHLLALFEDAVPRARSR